MKTLMITDEVYRKLAAVKGERSFSELLDEILAEVKTERNTRLARFFGILSDKEANEMKKNVAEFQEEFQGEAAMKAFLDASAIIDFMHGNTKLQGVISDIDEIFVSSLTAYEILVGERVERRVKETGLFLDEFIDVSFEKQHMKKACEISRALSKKGKLINLIDIMVAGQALVIGAAIITNDKDYERVSEVSELKTIVVR